MMNEQDLRDCFAMFAMLGRAFEYKEIEAQECYEIADAMLKARNKEPEDEGGIATIKKRKYVRKN